MEKFDGVVIGAGHNGLTLAAYLARAGLKAQQTRIEQERRAGVIHHLLNEANKQGEPSNVEGPAKETAPAK